MSSISGGALVSVEEFLNETVRTGKGTQFPYWQSDSGRWALAHYAKIKQTELEQLSSEGVNFRWRVGNVITRLWISPLPGGEGVLVVNTSPDANFQALILAIRPKLSAQDYLWLMDRPYDEALGYAFTLLSEYGVEDPEDFLRSAGVLE